MPQLLPLSLPQGWAIMFNVLYDHVITPANHPWFVEDLLWLTRVRLDATGIQRMTGDIDVGWYPSGQLDGAYRVRLLGEGGWDAILIDFASRDVGEVARAIRLCATAPLENAERAQAYFDQAWPEEPAAQAG